MSKGEVLIIATISLLCGSVLWVRSFTGMDIITGMDYRNRHYAMALGALNLFYLHKMYSCRHMNSLNKIKSISVVSIAKLTSQGG